MELKPGHPNRSGSEEKQPNKLNSTRSIPVGEISQTQTTFIFGFSNSFPRDSSTMVTIKTSFPQESTANRVDFSDTKLWEHKGGAPEVGDPCNNRVNKEPTSKG